MPVENIHLSQQAKDQLVKVKRHTGITNWNTLCRWAFFLSLAEESMPPAAKHPADSSVEMTWKVFSGAYHEVLWALLKERCVRDELPLDEETLAAQFRLHLHRGIAYLGGNRRVRSIADLMREIP